MAFSAIRRATDQRMIASSVSNDADTSIFDLPSHPTTAAPSPDLDVLQPSIQLTPMGRPMPTPSPRPRPRHRPHSHDPNTSDTSASQAGVVPFSSDPAPPPQYETHDFPPPDFQSGGPPPTQGGGRFPRWRGWLEKRAVERHYARMEAEAQGGSAGIGRKKTWGPAVDDLDAVSDKDSDSDTEEVSPGILSCGVQLELILRRFHSQSTIPSPPPPLHSHNFGSRFLPHLPSQPLCAVYLDLPSTCKAAQNTWPQPIRNDYRKHKMRSRKVLLVGTVEGLFVVEIRRPSPITPTPSQAGPSRPAAQASTDVDPNRKWNGEIRVVKVWSSLGVYQMSLLSSAPSSIQDKGTTATNGSASKTRITDSGDTASGILLALCAPEPSTSSSFLAPLNKVGAHAGAVLESLANAVPHGGSSSSSPYDSSYLPREQASSEAFPDNTPGQFGAGAGGGKSAVYPPTGQGQVRMWNLEAIIRIVHYALDKQDAEPLDLLSNAAKLAKDQNRISVALKKVWANLGDPPSERRERAARRQGSGGHIDPLPQSLSSDALNAGSPPLSHGRRRSNASQSMLRSDDALQSTASSADSTHAAVLKLALDSVPINSMNTSMNVQDSTLGSNPSFVSFFTDDGSAGIGSSGTGKQRARDKDPPGAIFYSVYEAPSDSKGAGTWYLAVATSKTILLYEAVPSASSKNRSFRFLRELYTPFTPLAATFVLSSSVDVVGSINDSIKLSVGAPNGPLLSSPGKHARHASAQSHGGAYTHARPPSTLPPVMPPDSSDLSILVSFGKRAVLIRLVDSHVSEIDVPGNPQRSAYSGPFLMERSRSETDSMETHPTSSKRKSFEASSELAAAATAASSKQWVGLSTITASVWLRPRPDVTKLVQPRAHRDASDDSISSPASLTPSATTWRASGSRAPIVIDSASRDKKLPATPAPLGLSFEPRADGEKSVPDAIGVRTVEDDSDDSDSEEDVRRDGSGVLHEHFHGVSLADEPVRCAGPKGRRPTLRPKKQHHSRTPSTWETANNVSVSVSLVSKGSATHVLPNPLPVDLINPRPITTFQWTSAPSSVSGFARVVAIERASSTGALSTGALSSAPGSGSTTDPVSAPPRRPYDHRRTAITVVLSLTALAFLPSCIEMRRATLRVAVQLPFHLPHDVELEVLPASQPPSSSSEHGPGQGNDMNDPTRRPNAQRERGPIFDPALRSSLVQSAASHTLQTEYPIAHLVPAPHLGGKAAPSTGRPWRPDAAVGDGGAFAWEWRGGDDFRICFVGAEV